MKTSILNDKLAPQGASIDRGSVLVVDDEEANRTLLRDPLEALGYVIVEAHNGQQALHCVAEHAPDAILLDVMMPGLDGFSVCRQLKQNPKTAPIPIIMVTALSERKERLLGIESGADDFLNKPVDIQEVSLRVASAVRSKQLFDQLQAEQARSEQLLLSILPGPIAERMKAGEVNIADFHPEATVLLAELVDFTKLSSHIGPDQVVQLLNEIFSGFDFLVEEHRLEKIKTVGDTYIVAGNLTFSRPDHAQAMAELALDMCQQVEELNRQYDTSIRLRSGLCSGPVIAGVIGRKKFAYDIWGDTVDRAAELAALGQAGTVLVAESAYDGLQQKYQLRIKEGASLKTQALVYQLEGRF